MAKQSWDLSIFYTGLDDPQFEKDLVSIETLVAQFAKKYRRVFAEKPKNPDVIAALCDYEVLQKNLHGNRPLMYLHYRMALDTADQALQAAMNKVNDRLVKAYNELAFFELAIGQLPKNQQRELLKDQTAQPFQYFLERQFLKASHQLSEAEEKLLARTQLTSYDLWTRGVESAIYKKTINFQGTKIPIAEALNLVAEQPTKARRALHQKIIAACKEVSEFAESELNAIVHFKKLSDELRHYPTPMSDRILISQNDEATVANLVRAVRSAYGLSHRFYRAKAKMLKLPQLQYADRAALAGKLTQKFSFEQSLSVIDEEFSRWDSDFSNILNAMVANGQVDVFAKKGKMAGGFCSSSIGNPTFILLNHVGSVDSVLTYAHEMGHAIHATLSKSQSVLYEDHSLSTAETASTFFESLVFERLAKDLSAKERVIALHNRLQDDVNTIFRQIALLSFEEELHQTIREKGAMSHQEIAKTMQKHLQSYLGDKVTVTEDDGYAFVQWPHIRFFFYVFTYAFGLLVSKALLKKVRENPDFIVSVKQFLSAGGCATPEDIFASIGIDIRDPQFFADGLVEIERDIIEFEKLINA